MFLAQETRGVSFVRREWGESQMVKRVFCIRESVEPLANSLERMGNGLVGTTAIEAEKLRTAIIHLRGKVQRVRGRYQDRWTVIDAMAVNVLIEFILVVVKDADR